VPPPVPDPESEPPEPGLPMPEPPPPDELPPVPRVVPVEPSPAVLPPVPSVLLELEPDPTPVPEPLELPTVPRVVPVEPPPAVLPPAPRVELDWAKALAAVPVKSTRAIAALLMPIIFGFLCWFSNISITRAGMCNKLRAGRRGFYGR